MVTKVKVGVIFAVFAFHGRRTERRPISRIKGLSALVCIQGLNLQALQCAQSLGSM